jgi:hypothetical protein
MCFCIETYLARGRLFLHPFFPCYGMSIKFRTKALEDHCVQLDSCLHISRMLLTGIDGPFLEPLQFSGFVPQCIFTILWPNATEQLPNKFYMLTCDWAPGLMTAGLPIYSDVTLPYLPILYQPWWLVWYKKTCSRKSCGTVNPCNTLKIKTTTNYIFSNRAG